jgi:hypothetical protein
LLPDQIPGLAAILDADGRRVWLVPSAIELIEECDGGGCIVRFDSGAVINVPASSAARLAEILGVAWQSSRTDEEGGITARYYLAEELRPRPHRLRHPAAVSENHPATR